ncbi:hypothetical protein PV08_05304 [Exophiala spinifera]|uniref:CENP-V/GFA domain-containing protein n=1 Tax=Exophiala spinifera TaxID=91928 RepID=A0A0D2BVF3_9EURO|nr:uncharacterized protein PV08_05304 [Exophiala spinifera]KIW15259.1 hypothetical protein PV08_05304 [Exophiala spinifera]
MATAAAAAETTTTTTPPRRQACRGSCHCGLTQYVVFLRLPHPFSATDPPLPTDQEVYRCNCSTCTKMNFFHVHPAHPRDDFMLLSPLDPDRELSTYQCFEKLRKYYFCPTCGVRCLTFGGVGETVALEGDDAVLVGGGGGGEAAEAEEEGGGGGVPARQVWRAKWDGDKDTTPYVAVNGTTIDPREDFDLRLLTEQKRVQYFDGWSDPKDEKDPRWDRPHDRGCY